MIRKPNALDVSLLIILAIIWASAFLGIKIALIQIDPLAIVFCRVAIGFLVLVPWCLWRGLVWPKDRNQWLLIFIITLLNVIAPYLLISWAQLTIDAGVAALLMGAGPLLSIIAAHLTTDDDKITVYKFIGVILGFIGIVFVIGPSAFASLGDELLAQGAALTGNLSYVVSGILIRKIRDIPPTRMTGLVLGFSTIGLLPIIATLGLPSISELTPQTIISLLYLGVFPTGLGYILRYHLIRSVGVGFFAMGINLIPVFGVLFGTLFLDEPLTVFLGLALVFVVSGLFVARIGMSSSDSSSPKN